MTLTVCYGTLGPQGVVHPQVVYDDTEQDTCPLCDALARIKFWQKHAERLEQYEPQR